MTLRLAALALALAAPAAVQAQGFQINAGATARTLTVSGDALVSAAPDRALVRFAVVTEGATPEAALRTHEEEVQRVLTAVRRFGIADRQIELNWVGLNENYDREGQRRGYAATRSVTVTLDDLRQVPDLVATVVHEGADRLEGVSYTLRDADRFEDRALEEAFARARAKAERLAAASGARLGEVVAVQEQGVTPPMPIPMPVMARAESADYGGMPGAYSAGSSEVRAAVVVTFELR